MDIDKEFDEFFHFPTEKKDSVTSVSSKIFVKHCIEKNERSMKDYISTLEHHKEILMSGIEKCLDENGHLADGEDCTLIDLKKTLRKISN